MNISINGLIKKFWSFKNYVKGIYIKLLIILVFNILLIEVIKICFLYI